MEFLTSTIISGIAWDGIKKIGCLTGEYIKNQLKEWMIDDLTCERIAKKINDIPNEYKKSSKFLEVAIDEDEEIVNLLKSAKHNTSYVQNNTGNFIKDSNVVNGNNNVTTINNHIKYDKKKAEVKIVNIEIERDEDGFPTLDIKLRNIGDEIAFLKKVVFNIYDFYEMINPSIVDFSRVDSSYTYDVALCGFDKKQVSISQSIPHDEVDRFKIKIANAIGDDPEMPTIYRFSISVIYNEDNSVIESDQMILSIRPLEEWEGCFRSDWSKQKARENYINLKRFNKENVYKCDWFITLYNSYEKNKNDFMK